MPKIVRIAPTIDPLTVKLVLDDNTVVHYPKDGCEYEVGDTYVAPPVEVPTEEPKPGEVIVGGLDKDGNLTQGGLSGFAEVKA